MVDEVRQVGERQLNVQLLCAGAAGGPPLGRRGAWVGWRARAWSLGGRAWSAPPARRLSGPRAGANGAGGIVADGHDAQQYQKALLHDILLLELNGIARSADGRCSDFAARITLTSQTQGYETGSDSMIRDHYPCVLSLGRPAAG
jgi:hypothetical protein